MLNIQTIYKQQTGHERKNKERDQRSNYWECDAQSIQLSATITMVMGVCYLYGSVLSLRETPQRGEKVDVSALDKLPLCLAKLLLSLSTPEQCRSWIQNIIVTWCLQSIYQCDVSHIIHISIIQINVFTHHRVCWTPSPAQSGSFGLPVPHVHEAEVGRSNPDAHTAGPLTALLFNRDQRAQLRFKGYLF